VVPSHNVQDKEIAHSVLAALSRKSHVEAHRVTVVAENGTVMLSGNVESPAARQSAYWAAIHTMGVVDVVNNLRISS
jgi:osmotically-inducible protein OsmY